MSAPIPAGINSDLPSDLIVRQRDNLDGHYREIAVRPIADYVFGFDTDKNPRSILRGSRRQGAPTAMTTAATISVAGMLGGIITATHAAGATAAYTLPTGTVMDAADPADFEANESFDVTIINLSTAAADTVTLTAASGFTIVGDPIVQSAHVSSTRSNSGTFRCRKTAANTYVAYRIS
jgi:hypothetical protein